MHSGAGAFAWRPDASGSVLHAEAVALKIMAGGDVGAFEPVLWTFGH